MKERAMQKVEMTVSGRRALVDADMVKKMVRKQKLVADATAFSKYLKADPVNHAHVAPLLDDVMRKLIRLNRTIRPTVEFLE